MASGRHMTVLEETIAAIRLIDHHAASLADKRLNSLTKPPGSLGYLEEIVRRYAAIRRDGAAKKGQGAIAVFVADHGIADEGVSAFPKAVTIEMLRNIAGGGAAISVLAKRFGYELRVVDVGVEADSSDHPFEGVTYRRIGPGTRNFLRAAAMTREDAIRATEVGINLARELAAAGVTLIGIGEMGIANSTSAAAVMSAMTGIPPARLAGRGTGLDDPGLKKKIAVIENALALHDGAFGDGVGTLTALGGFEIAAMVGACLGGAAVNVPVVVDGFIATAAAIAANRIAPGLTEHMFFSHRSAEGGHREALEWLHARPILDLDMRLGEGTGAALAMSVIESALDLFHQMATFETASVSGKIR
ncbi:MAG TPA: nicotinate-nucleotide--dimethylbenzimidazole phosphoribosyltransferase [Candidatus Binataceae bacterium]|nr:nicotinate-nucleotide--dimethylbenzimidazole phosphoribosyltransferase [Candidatus Binataceae bacterium]